MREACWTCRNRTIQCDQSCFPCLKCKKAGLECRDKKPLRWVQGVAIRGRMRGYMYKETPTNHDAILPTYLRSKRVRRGGHQLQLTLQDPRMQNLDLSSRYYIDYCECTGNLLIQLTRPRQPAYLQTVYPARQRQQPVSRLACLRA